MSLIDEALKRARQEAARQDEAAREARYRQVPVVPVIPGLRPSERPAWLLPVAIAACLALAIGIGLGLTFSRGGAERKGETQAAATPPPAGVTASPSAPDPAPPVVDTAPVPVVEEEPAAEVEETPEPVPAPVTAEPIAAPPVPEAAPAPPREEPRVTQMREREIPLAPTTPRPQPTPVEPEVTEPAPAPTPAPATPAPASETPAPATVPGTVRTYQQELPVAGGGTLRLSGIAFSERPVALFGDKVVAPGESIAGYKVLAIEPRLVRLEGPGGGTVVVEMQ